MKRILTLIALAAAVIATASCDKEGGNETPTVEFARVFYQLYSESSVDISVRLSQAAEQDVVIPLEFTCSTAVIGENYTVSGVEVAIKAGETCGYVTLTVLRSERISDEVVQLQLTLLSNEYFNLPLTYLVEMPGRYSEELTAFYRNPDPRVHNIFISDVLTQPKLWPPKFGVYSNKKMEMFLEFYPDKSYDDYSTTSTLPMVVQSVIVEMTANYLIENFKAGNPILDPDGTMMWVDAGLPWEETSLPEDVVLE